MEHTEYKEARMPTAEDQRILDANKLHEARKRRNIVAVGLTDAGNIFVGLAWLAAALGVIAGGMLWTASAATALLLILASVSAIPAAYAIRCILHGLAELLRCAARAEDRELCRQDACTPAGRADN